jgi:D-glycero-D-manno-heptose 1,7-bisphosphate phosphatase
MRPDYVRRWEDLEIIPGALRALARLTAAGFELIVLSNQSAIGRGLVKRETVDDINQRLAEVIQTSGGRITEFLICPHAPADGCDCRKPAPGLLLRARDELGADLENAVLVGDQLSDMEAARAAGCQAILVAPDAHETRRLDRDGYRVAGSLSQAVDLILEAGR